MNRRTFTQALGAAAVGAATKLPAQTTNQTGDQLRAMSQPYSLSNRRLVPTVEARQSPTFPFCENDLGKKG